MAGTTLYYRDAEGTLVSRAVSGEAARTPEVPEGATALTSAEYEAALADVEAQRHAHAQQLTETDEANQSADYEALRASGIPEATARRLAGFTGPDEAD
ncbi:hypothetical protein PV387_03375 [Streptomyces sp. ME02-6987-2C]|uniref:hypothetical protein n=1 Tax=unclassified Streptomyces TaxID=2593676 RepID=UPI0029B2412E|nr:MULTISPECIES: hypothetical protein [unclassified Streptomyces]MDX3345880.1 hypothetical protein [Streptomyces sp. ME02-6979A]MDX3365075.1 hypothetical protein [Streptomyces sp. ME02-6987-2C]MDX3404870.1 hypothetical protein [Streptomyces sp. ME02-6977A]MDX3421646.1 hypothetical protein [Streptomyces sp. ME02-6985-2c]